MNPIYRLDAWSERHKTKWILLLRIAFGLLLWFKGFSFISHTNQLEELIARNNNFKEQAYWLAGYVAWSHFFGGFMILIGLFTRMAVLIQIPVLIGAIFFVNTAGGLMNIDPQLGLSILVLILLIFFLFEGGGPYSADRFIKRKLL